MFEKELEVREMPFLTPERLPIFNQVQSSKAYALFTHPVPPTTSQAFVRLLDIMLDSSLPPGHRCRNETLFLPLPVPQHSILKYSDLTKEALLGDRK